MRCKPSSDDEEGTSLPSRYFLIFLKLIMMFNADSHPQENATLLPEIDDGAQRKDDSPEEGVGLFVAFVFTVNMVIGAGIVGLPYAFFHAGAFFSLACLVSATVMAVTTMGYILEVSGWCEGWIAANEAESARSDSPEAPRDIHPFSFVISSKRKFELNELCGVFLGIPVPASCPWLRRFADERGELHPVRRVPAAPPRRTMSVRKHVLSMPVPKDALWSAGWASQTRLYEG